MKSTATMNGSTPQARVVRSVLIADPCPVASHGLAQALTARGVQAWIADDLESTLGLLSAHRPDLLLLELSLRDATWRDVMAVIPRDLPITAMILTARGSIASAVGALKGGLANYLVKPATVEQILA